MDSKDNFLSKLGTFIRNIDDEYLIGITNKGILNRSKKDLEKIKNIEYEINEDNIKFKLDEVECVIKEEFKNTKCSCPSRTICKHIIMSYLYLNMHKDEIFKEEECTKEELIEEKFLQLKDYTLEEIKKNIGDKNFFNIIKRISFGFNYEIIEGSVIKVNFGEEGIVVTLLNEIENSVCSCKSKELCKHKAEALILYKLEKGYLTLEELLSYEKKIKHIDEEEIKKVSKEIRYCIEEILISGLARCTETTIDRLNNMAIICHNYDLPNFEKELRNISKEVSLYFNKNASFTSERLLRKLTTIYTNTFILETTNNLNVLTKLIGEFKSSYYEIPIVKLHGVAQENWTSKSGYEGTTYYFYENEKKIWFTYTNAMPIFYENNTKSNNYKRLNASSPWQLNCKLEELSSITFKLIHGKINSKNRISSSSESKGIILDKSSILDLDIQKYYFDNWKNIINSDFINNVNSETSNIIFIKGNKFSESCFHSITQTLDLQIYDYENNIIKINIQFSLMTKKLIRTLERLSKKEPPLFLGRIYVENSELKFYPLAYYKDGIACNLT